MPEKRGFQSIEQNHVELSFGTTGELIAISKYALSEFVNTLTTEKNVVQRGKSVPDQATYVNQDAERE